MTEPTDFESVKVTGVNRVSKLDDVEVHLDENNRLTVEFRIQDLVRRLVPKGDLASFCGGCNGCMGCSM
jgi:hypothetical protein